MIRTKLCGITNSEELKIAINSGTDAIGFLVGQRHNAYGFISPKQANILCNLTTPFVSTVIVTHFEEPCDLILLSKQINATTLQIHSDITLDNLIEVRNEIICKKIICKISIIDESSIERALRLQDYVDAFVLDTIDIKNDKVGGTGTIHDWNISKQIVLDIKKPVILAGGLNPHNIIKAIEIVKPWGVDVNSGIKKGKVLDIKLTNEFVSNAKMGNILQ